MSVVQAVAGGANVPAQATRRSQRRAAWDVAIRLAPRCSFMAEIRMPARHQLRIIPPNVTVQWPASRPRSGPSANVLAKGDIPVGFIFFFFLFYLFLLFSLYKFNSNPYLVLSIELKFRCTIKISAWMQPPLFNIFI
jgi:hypothetical protein